MDNVALTMLFLAACYAALDLSLAFQWVLAR